MNTRALATILLTTVASAGAAMAGCSGSNNPSTSNSTGTGTANTTSGNTGTNTGSNSNTSTASSSASTTTTTTSTQTGTAASDAGTDSGVPTCPSGLQDKITPCTASDLQQCTKGCGPDLPAGSAESNLGTKTCTCTTGVYQCADCSYISPLPLCYQQSATAPACEAGVADKLPCGTPCTTGTGNDVCLTTSDAGKSEGCVCITGGAGNVWTCATVPW